jgi:uncharacterized membrane protein
VGSKSDAALFEAVIVPHRSLSPQALHLLLGAIAATCVGTAFLFLCLRAWPVSGFFALELLLAAYLVRLNARGARASELIILSEHYLTVIRTDPKGVRRETALPPAWLRVRLEEDPRRTSALMLVARDIREEVGHSLGETEKRQLAQALQTALSTWRNPTFDNPQLQE